MLLTEFGRKACGHLVNKRDPGLANLVLRTRKEAGKLLSDTFDLENWCSDRAFSRDEPDVHRPFVSAFDVSESKFQLHLTTAHMLQLAERLETHGIALQADTTAKLIWNGFPIVVIGCQDRDRHFHVLQISVVWKNEDTEVYTTCFQVRRTQYCSCM